MAQSFEQWLESLGPVTKACLGLIVGLAAVSTFGMLSPYSILLTKEALFSLQLWRFVTAAFFLGSFSFPWIMSVFMFYTFLNYNEQTNFKNKTADFVWAFAFIIITHGLLGLYFGQMITSFSVAMSLCWMFCKRNPEMRLTLYSFEFRAPTFPWALMVLNLIISQRIFDDLLGIFVGHLYVYLHDVVPLLFNVNALRTPSFVKNIVEGKRGTSALHPSGKWGTGRRLGGPE